MSPVSVDDLMAFNDQLIALRRAGVPLDLGLTPDAADLERINAVVARGVSRGEPIGQAVRGCQESASSLYIGKLLVGLREGRLPGVLDGAARVADASQQSRSDLTGALSYPLLIAVLACLGLGGFSVMLTPVIAETYADLRQPPGRAVELLLWVREGIWFWVAAAGIALLLLGCWVRRAGRRPSAAVARQRWAECAGLTADMLDAGVPLAEARPLASAASGVGTGAAPPLLEWAAEPMDDAADQSRALRAAEAVYGGAAQRRAERFGRVAPIVTTITLGGAFALAYGLALFVPIIELLTTLAQP